MPSWLSTFNTVMLWIGLLFWLIGVQINARIEKRMNEARQRWWTEERGNLAQSMLITADMADLVGNAKVAAQMRNTSAQILNKPN